MRWGRLLNEILDPASYQATLCRDVIVLIATLEGLLGAELLEASIAEEDVTKVHKLGSRGSSPLHIAGENINKPVSAA